MGLSLLKQYFLLSSIQDFLLFIRCKMFRGSMIRLEASSVCQLQCPICPTGQRKTKETKVGWGSLSFDSFQRLVDENPQIKLIELSNWGEIFLNPELKKIIEYAAMKRITLSASNGVNLNTLSKEMAETLVKNRFRSITVSIDGASQETYAKYRKNGNFDRVIGHVQLINSYKRQFNSKYPLMKWQFVVFGHNEHEVSKAKEMARKLNMRFYVKENWNAQFSPTKASIHKQPRQQIGSKAPYFLSYCNQLWISPQVNWDGNLLGCCVNKTTSFGNVFEQGLEECLNSKDYQYLKKMVAGKAAARQDMPCLSCRHYRGRRPLISNEPNELSLLAHSRATHVDFINDEQKTS